MMLFGPGVDPMGMRTLGLAAPEICVFASPLPSAWAAADAAAASAGVIFDKSCAQTVESEGINAQAQTRNAAQMVLEDMLLNP